MTDLDHFLHWTEVADVVEAEGSYHPQPCVEVTCVEHLVDILNAAYGKGWLPWWETFRMGPVVGPLSVGNEAHFFLVLKQRMGLYP